MKPKVSVIIATFNSEKLLGKVLNSLKKQTYPKSQIEIIVVDGGSTDSTLEIINKHKCRLIVNPRTEPVYGKYLAYTKAEGRYIMYIDHDEVLLDKNSIATKISCFKENPNVKVVLGSGYVNPKGYPFINKYINEFGDPFSFFVYRLSKLKNQFIRSMKSKYKVSKDTKDYLIFDLSGLSTLPIIEIVSIGSMFDASVLKKDFPNTLKDSSLLPHYFYLLHSKYPKLGIVKGDIIRHYSSSTFAGYLKKLKWRVKNNIFFVESLGASGFTGRQRYQSSSQNIIKFLFIPYSLSLIFPFMDAIYLSVTRKDMGYLAHIYLCFYMAVLIINYYLLKLFGYRPKLRSYDESKVIRT